MKTRALGVFVVSLILLGCIQDGAYASPAPTYAVATATIGPTPTPSASPVPSAPAAGQTCPDGTTCPAGTSCAARCTDTIGGAPEFCDYGCVPTVAPTTSPTIEPTPWAGGKPTATPRPIDASAKEMPFERMNESQYISHRMVATYVFNDAASWDQFRNTVTSNDPEGRNVLPDVDFTQKTVLAAFSGMKTSGGYTTLVMRIVEEPDRVAVVVQETTPGNCLVTHNITYPGDIVTVVKTGKPVDFILEYLSRQCTE